MYTLHCILYILYSTLHNVHYKQYTENVYNILETAYHNKTREEYANTQSRLHDLEETACEILQASQASIGVNQECLKGVLTAIDECKKENSEVDDYNSDLNHIFETKGEIFLALQKNYEAIKEFNFALKNSIDKEDKIRLERSIVKANQSLIP